MKTLSNIFTFTNDTICIPVYQSNKKNAMQNQLNCNIILKILHSIDDLLKVINLINTSMILVILADSLLPYI